MHLKTRLTEKLGIAHPILLAPMNVFAGGKLAAAVSAAGGLGLIGGGYGDPEWLEREFAAAGSARVGCGFITWSMARDPKLLDQALDKNPAALMLSFGDVEPQRPVALRQMKLANSTVANTSSATNTASTPQRHTGRVTTPAASAMKSGNTTTRKRGRLSSGRALVG